MKFFPDAIFRQNCDNDASPHALIILNQPLTSTFYTLWSICQFRACADGGANRLYDQFESDEARLKYLPDFIAGDFDSLRDEVREFYSGAGVHLLHDPDQYSTDFMKCARQIDQTYNLIALGGTGGRVDQSFHSIYHLFLSNKRRQLLYLVSPESVTFLVEQGEGSDWSTIETPRDIFGDTCGIIPILGSSIISTKGLRWDVNDWETSFESQVSTNNKLSSDQVMIRTNRPVLFTLEIRTQ